MDQPQKNHRKMFGNVLAWFQHAGTVLLKINKIKELVVLVTADVQALDTQAGHQGADTGGLTRTRTAIKKEAAEKAEALRGFVVELTTDETLKTALAKPVSQYLYGAEADFLTYCTKVAAAVPTLPAECLNPGETGYDPKILNILATDLEELTTSVGEVVLLQKAAAAATDNLLPLFAKVDADLVSLDKFVHLQRFAHADLVAQYEALRQLPKTPAAHQYRAKGDTPYDVPQLVFNILDESIPTPTLYNTGSRGHEVVFYLGATPTSRPRPGQGKLVLNGKKYLVADYHALGDPATEQHLLALQTTELAPGGWRVRG